MRRPGPLAGLQLLGMRLFRGATQNGNPQPHGNPQAPPKPKQRKATKHPLANTPPPPLKGYFLGRATTIAVRYAAVRRQTAPAPGGGSFGGRGVRSPGRARAGARGRGGDRKRGGRPTHPSTNTPPPNPPPTTPSPTHPKVSASCRSWTTRTPRGRCCRWWRPPTHCGSWGTTWWPSTSGGLVCVWGSCGEGKLLGFSARGGVGGGNMVAQAVFWGGGKWGMLFGTEVFLVAAFLAAALAWPFRHEHRTPPFEIFAPQNLPF